MDIFFKYSGGQQGTLNVLGTDTVESLKHKIKDKTGIPVDNQRLLYSGKQLEGSCVLSDYGIYIGSTLEVIVDAKAAPMVHVPHDSALHSIPSHTHIPSHSDILHTWALKAEKGDFDVDLHIVEPQAYFDKLDHLEESVYLNSEFFHCREQYNLLDNSIPPCNNKNDLKNVPLWMWESLHGFGQGPLEPPADAFEVEWQQDHKTVSSLWKSYLILCQVLTRFSKLEEDGFSKNFFSLLRRSTADTAEVLKIFPASQLQRIKLDVENALGHVLENFMAGNWQHFLVDLVEEPCLNFLGRSGFYIPHVESSSSSIAGLLRTTVLLIDLAMISYVGSHGSQLSDAQMGVSSPPICIPGNSRDEFSISCGRQRMSCLNGFLDSKLVWVFECHKKNRPQESKDLLLLTTMDAFGDLWGPVWSIPSSNGKSIKQYNVSKGVICPMANKNSPRPDGAIHCHWYSWSSYYRRRMSNLLKNSKEEAMDPGALLLIGGGFRHNQECDYTLDEFEEDFEDEMNVIGTSPEAWRMESRTLGFSISKTVGISVTGTQKKIPQTTLKQHILDRWTNKPERANPGFLNMCLGVEISHCTGNARRISIRELLLLSTVQPLLERRHPNWRKTGWGSSFYEALRSPSPQFIYHVWTTFSDYRAQMAELVCCVLEILDTAGFSNDRFTAGYFNKNQELAITLDHRADNWAVLLKDSHLMATFPVLNQICLEFHTPDHSTATCGSSKLPTVFQTQIHVTRGDNHDRIKLDPCGEMLKKVEVGSNTINLFSLQAGLNRTLTLFATAMSNNIANGVERRDQSTPMLSPFFFIRAYAASSRRAEILIKRAKRKALKFTHAHRASSEVPTPTPSSQAGRLPFGNENRDPLSQFFTTPPPIRFQTQSATQPSPHNAARGVPTPTTTGRNHRQLPQPPTADRNYTSVPQPTTTGRNYAQAPLPTSRQRHQNSTDHTTRSPISNSIRSDPSATRMQTADLQQLPRDPYIRTANTNAPNYREYQQSPLRRPSTITHTQPPPQSTVVNIARPAQIHPNVATAEPRQRNLMDDLENYSFDEFDDQIIAAALAPQETAEPLRYAENQRLRRQNHFQWPSVRDPSI